MAILRLTRTVDATPSAVFSWVADYRNAPSFIDGLEPLRPIGGSSFEAVLHLGPRRIEAVISLAEVEVDQLVTWAMSSAESRCLSFRLGEVPGGTAVELGVTYDRPTRLPAALMAPVIDDAVRRLADGALRSIARSLAGECGAGEGGRGGGPGAGEGRFGVGSGFGSDGPRV